MGTWDNLRWLVVLNGTADAYFWPFDTDEWHLWCGSPAQGMLGLMPFDEQGPTATFEDAQWVANAVAYDHDAPVGLRPVMTGSRWDRHSRPRDLKATNPIHPVSALLDPEVDRYWLMLADVHEAAADLRFNGCWGMRYELENAWPGYDEAASTTALSTRFRARFKGREELLALYAMAARQADAMGEYLCLYRVLEAADGRNGKTFAQAELGKLLDTDFGELRIFPIISEGEWISAFDAYKHRARVELNRLAHVGVTNVPGYLYGLRNGLAHGKREPLTSGDLGELQSVVRALPIVKLLARLAIEGDSLLRT